MKSLQLQLNQNTFVLLTMKNIASHLFFDFFTDKALKINTFYSIKNNIEQTKFLTPLKAFR